MDHGIERVSINPPDSFAHAKFNFDEAQLHVGGGRILAISGQISDPAGSMGEQIKGSLDAIGVILDLAGLDRAALVKLGIYTVDVDAFVANWQVMLDWFDSVGVVPPNTVVPVTRLINPRVIIEIDALAIG